MAQSVEANGFKPLANEYQSVITAEPTTHNA
jgi:hypothetical protein